MTHYELLTIGYGRDTKEGFQERLHCFLNPKEMMVIDIRRRDSRSRNGKWAWWGFAEWPDDCMGRTVEDSGMIYETCHDLANSYGKTRSGMKQYANAIKPYGALRDTFCRLKSHIAKSDLKTCLLCAERKPYIGNRPNCHRVILADRLCLELHLRTGADILWTVTHIE